MESASIFQFSIFSADPEKNSGYIVNLRNIKSIEKDMVLMSNGDRLPVSRARKKIFLHRFAMYLGGSFQ
jgi:hypothetical protein